MGKRGPKPTDKKTLQLRGSWRGGTKQLAETAPSGLGSVGPICPSYITGEARIEWRYIVPRLVKLGFIEKVDRTTLAAYCTAYQRWRQAERLVTSLMVKTVNGNIIQHPALSIAERSLLTMNKLAADIGLSPRARTGLKVVKQETKKQDSKTSMFIDTA